MQINPTPEAFVRQVREANERDYGPKAREMARTLLSAGLPHPWLYVFELSQNARDAGARWVKWTVTDTGDVVLQHDGPEPLEERHVRGLASVGASTKGLTSVGFMGVGFKAAFSRFKTVGVSGFGWKFRFDVGTEHGDLGAERPDLFDTLLPSWDPDLPDPEPGFTTRFDLRAPRGPDGAPFEDLAHLCSVDDPTPLAVLALRGLKRVSVGDRTWGLHATDGIAEVHDSARDAPWRWVFFRASYRPDDTAMRRFLEVRKALRDQVDSTGERPFREVIALLPIDGAGRPVPPARGHVYATLPTQVELPFRFHLQADWLVNLDRQNLRDVVGDPWHEAILKRVPELIRQLLLWVAERPEVRRSGWEALLVPRSDEGTLGAAFENLRSAIGAAIGDLAVVPVHGAPEQELRRPPDVWRLPSKFRAEFGRRAGWRPDLLFDRDVMDEAKLGDSATQFFLWLGYGPEIVPPIHAWPAALPRWWSGVPEDERHDALFALWNSVAAPPWQESPVVRTEDGAWVGAGRIRWLNEEPPSPGERSGEVIAAALADLLPSPGERLAPGLRQVVQKAGGPGIEWFKRLRQGVELKAVIQQALADKTRREAFPLVQLLDLALSRGQRADLVPWILTEEGPRKPADALLADPYVEGGMHRRSLFGNSPAIHQGYLDVASVEALVPFFRKLGVRGDVALLPERAPLHGRWVVARELGIEVGLVENANARGYTVVNMSFPRFTRPFPAEALADWLSRGYRALDGKGRVFAESTYYVELVTRGARKANWVRYLEEVAWVPCTDGERRKPADVRLQADPDYEGVPIAALDSEFGKRLQQEGVEFGANVSKAPALRRLASRGAGALEDKVLAQLLRDARASVGAGEATDAQMNEALSVIRVRERPLAGC